MQSLCVCFFFSSRRRHTRCSRDWSSDVCSSDLIHRDVGVERTLDAHRFFRRQEEAIAVDRRGEVHALLGEAAQRAEAEHLEAARIRSEERRVGKEWRTGWATKS